MAHSGETVMLGTGDECAKSFKVKEENMLYWAAMFLIIALIAAFFGFVGVATAAAGIAKILFYIFLVIFLVTLIIGVGRRGTSV